MILFALCLGAWLPMSNPIVPQETGKQEAAVSLRFVPKLGERLQHNWLGTHKLLATEVYSRVEGKDRESVSQLPELETKERRITTDHVLEVKGGKIAKLRRTWVDTEIWGKLDFHFPGQAPLEVVLKSPLANNTTSVVFTHVPEEGGYGAYFDQSAMAESLLQNVRMDQTCEEFLPAADVRVGDTWQVDVKHLVRLLAPTGSMDYQQVKPGGAMLIRTLLMGVGGCAENVWNPDTLKGHLELKLVKIAGTGSLALAHVQVDYKFETIRDRSEAARELQMLGESNRGTIVISNSVRLTGEGRGTLIWNMHLNRAHSYTLTGTEGLDMVVKTQALNQPAVTQTMKLQGISELNYRATVLPEKASDPSWTGNPHERPANVTVPAEPK